MAVRCRGLEDRVCQTELPDDGCRSEVEEFLDLGCDVGVGGFAPFLRDAVAALGAYVGGAVGVNEDAYRLGNADGVCHLHEALVGNSCSNEVLRDVARRIGCGPVHL